MTTHTRRPDLLATPHDMDCLGSFCADCGCCLHCTDNCTGCESTCSNVGCQCSPTWAAVSA